MPTPHTYPVPQSILDMDLETHHVVEASAGTGKTFLIEHRVVDLIIRRELELKDILIVTFTEKATAELRHRICSIISKVISAPLGDSNLESDKHNEVAMWTCDEAAMLRLQKSLDQSESAPISTIHGFCQKLIGERPLQDGRISKRTVAPPWQLFRSAVERCVDDTFSTHPELTPYLKAYLDHAPIRFQPREELLTLLHQAAHFGGHLYPVFDENKLIENAALLQKMLSKHTPEEWATNAVKHGATRKAIASRLLGLGELLNEEKTSWPDKLAKLPELKCTYILEKKSESKEMTDLQGVLADFLDQALSLKSILTQLFLPYVQNRSHELKTESGSHDFNDMIEKAHALVHNAPSKDLANQLAGQYPCAFIDEFQDTDRLQWEIFKTIYVTDQNNATLTVVGDPKQSIYGFRGADLHTYFKAKKSLLKHGGNELRLDVNFRSSPALVQALNDLLTTDAPFFTGDVDYKNPVKAGREFKLTRAKEQTLEPLVLMHVEEEGLKIGAIKEKCLQAIPAQILNILDKDNPLVVTENDQEHTLQARDIMILTRTSAESQVLAKMCRAQGIPVSVFQQDALFLSKEAMEIRDLFYAIEYPDDSRWLHRAMLSRFCQCTSQDILSNPGSERYVFWQHTIKRWHELFVQNNMSRLLSSIKTDSSFFVVQAIEDESRRSLVNMNHLFELILDSSTPAKSLSRGVAEWLHVQTTRARTPLGFDVPKERIGSELNAVQIMTFHKSKGLEAHVVFLFGLFSSPKKKWTTDIIDNRQKETWLGDLPEEKQRLRASSQKAEDERLIYVAMTRAKSRLYLPYISSSKKSVTGSYSILNERLEKNLDNELVLSLSASPDHQLVDESRQSPKRSGLAEDMPLLALKKTDWRDRTKMNRTSYTKLSKNRPSKPISFKEAFVQTQSPRNELLSRGAKTGIWLHKVIEHLDINHIGEAPKFEEWYEISRKRNHVWDKGPGDGMEQRAWATLLHKAFHTSLNTDETDLGPLHLLMDSSREFNFSFTQNDSNGPLLVEGSIDFAFQKENQLYMIDWKSDALTDLEQSHLEKHTITKYGLQAQIYSTALRKMTRDHITFGGVFYFYLRSSDVVFLSPKTLESLVERNEPSIFSRGGPS